MGQCWTSWRSGYCYLNKGECNLNQSKDDCFVERVVKNNSWDNGDRHKVHEIFLINCFIFVITVVWKTVRSSAMTQIKAHSMEKNIATNCSQVTVPVLAIWTKKPFGHYAMLKLFPQITKTIGWIRLNMKSQFLYAVPYCTRSDKFCMKKFLFNFSFPWGYLNQIFVHII